MANLVPCPHCFRHIRVASNTCPFCDGSVEQAAISQYATLRSEIAPSGVKRATLFALSATVAAACSANTEPGSSRPSDSTSAPVSTSSLGDTSTTTSESISTDNDSSAQPTAMPHYGAVPPPSVNDPTWTSATNTEWLATNTSAGDAGLGDAGPDAGEINTPPDEPDPDLHPVPVYGAPPAP